MKRFPLVLLCLVVGGVSALLWHGSRVSARMRAEIAALGVGRDSIAALRRENQRLAVAAAGRGDLAQAEHAELVRLRARIEGWQLQLEQIAARPAAKPAAAAGELPSRAAPPPWQNKGRATAAGACETSLWAQWHGDLEAFLPTVSFAAEAREKLATLFSAQPAEDRARYGSPERMAAMLALSATAGSAAGDPLPMQLVERPQDADNVDVTLRVQLPQGPERERTLRVRRFADGWKVILPMEQANMLETTLTCIPPTQRAMKLKH
jgi:hypothetical protein